MSSGTVTEQSSQHPKVKGLSQAIDACTGREKNCVFFKIYFERGKRVVSSLLINSSQIHYLRPRLVSEQVRSTLS